MNAAIEFQHVDILFTREQGLGACDSLHVTAFPLQPAQAPDLDLDGG